MIRFNFLVAILVTLIGAFLSSACNPRELPPFKKLSEWSEKETTRQTEEAIKNDLALQEVDGICKNIPLSGDFEFLWKARLDERRLILAHHYVSDVHFDEARVRWVKYFSDNGWSLEKWIDGKRTKRLEFSSSDYRVIIEHQPSNHTMNYAIYCEKNQN